MILKQIGAAICNKYLNKILKFAPILLLFLPEFAPICHDNGAMLLKSFENFRLSNNPGCDNSYNGNSFLL